MKHILFFLLLLVIGCQSSKIVTDLNPLNLPSRNTSYKNIKIIGGNIYTSGPCEPSIAINPKNPMNIVAGNVMDNYHYSFDGGKTWETKQLTSTMGVFGDPCIIADNEGAFYYLHLANPDRKAYSGKHFLNEIVIQNSQNGGKTWDNGTGMGNNEPAQQDKEWAAIDPKTGAIYVTWTEFDKYGSKDTKHKSRIRFVASTDGGETFSKAITISELEGDAVDDDYTTEGAVPVVDLEGNIYVTWAFDNKLFFDTSTDHGKTWLKEDRIIAEQIGGWAQDIPAIGRCNGMPVTGIDVSSSKHRGTIYVNWTDQRNGAKDTDIFLIKSTDQGKTWSKPLRVNQDKTKTHQFFTWMSVDPVTGYIYIVYYDRSHYRKNKTDVALATSKDGGTTFTNEIISSSSFTPTKGIFFGDYNNISTYNGIVRPIWTRYTAGELSVWTALINEAENK